MLAKVKIDESGDSEFIPGSVVNLADYEETNVKLAEQGLEQQAR